MEVKHATSDVINSLITTNNDRYEGYKTAAEETKDAELKTMFNKFSQQSKGFADELRTHLPAEARDEKNPGKTSAAGKTFRAWMDLKSAVTSKDRKAILSSCEFGEDAALKSYTDALDHSEDLSKEALSVIKKHQSELQKGHDTVKNLRDTAK